MLSRRYSILLIFLFCLALSFGCGPAEGEKESVSSNVKFSAVGGTKEDNQNQTNSPNREGTRTQTGSVEAEADKETFAKTELDLMKSDSAKTDKTETVQNNLRGGVIRTIDQWRATKFSRPVRSLVCSGSGALRLVTFLNGADQVIAVEQLEKREGIMAAYRVAHPEYANLPVFGEGHGRDNIEVLLKLNPRPDLIVRIDNPGAGIDPAILQAKTGIPVLLLPYGDLGKNRATFDSAIRLLGEVIGKQDRANELLNFIDGQINELRKRTAEIPIKTSSKTSLENGEKKKGTVYLGGLSYRGSHGFNSTSICYSPLDWLNLRNVAVSLGSNVIRTEQIMVSKEQILAWDPDYIFLDLGTIALGDSNGWAEVSRGAIYRTLKTVKTKKIYSLYPNNFYSANYDAILANAWFIGSVVYPDRFSDIDPRAKAEEIFKFMTGGEVMARLSEDVRNELFVNLFEKKK